MKKELAAELRESLRGRAASSRVFAINGLAIKRVRANYRLSQGQFAAMLGISVDTLQNWEQGRRKPEGSACVLLQVAARYPDVVWDVVRPATGVRKNIARAGKTKRKLRS